MPLFFASSDKLDPLAQRLKNTTNNVRVLKKYKYTFKLTLNYKFNIHFNLNLMI